MIYRSIISRYLIKEVLITLLGVAMVLFMIFLSGQLVTLYSMAASGNLEVKDILTTLGLQSIANLPFVLPLSFYIAILLAFSRLYRDNEMVVLSACGVSQWQVLRAVMGMAIAFALIMAFLSLYLVPWSESKTEIIYKQAKQRSTLESLSAGRFKELTKGEGVVYVQEYNPNDLRMKKIFMQHRVRHNDSIDDSIITAATGYRTFDKQTGDQFLVLENGFRYEALGKTKQTAIVQFEKHGVRVDEDINKPKVELQQHAMPTMELLARGTGPDHAELQWRISTALLMIVLAMLGIPLSRSSPRQGRYSKLALALLIYIIYTNLLNVSRAWLNRETISIWVGMWWVHLLGVLLALAMLINWKPLLHRFWHGR
ncbi:MAG: LPS export ABC transporter permease LptF [Gammaproteobacteria bacterium]|nr:LPS export ABC transporter permease LptF [Gammaproteobacteria bacterium]